ncbi:MAG: hypothetical protein L0Z62_44750 [Gemmataceae bacterium]|nr:hypothetical protein [Gemmataceae bacterium]
MSTPESNDRRRPECHPEQIRTDSVGSIDIIEDIEVKIDPRPMRDVLRRKAGPPQQPPEPPPQPEQP